MTDDGIRADIEAAWRELDAGYLVELTTALAAIPTPLGDEEPTARHLADSARSRGLTAHVQDVVPGRANTVVDLPGSGGGRTLLLNGHLETGTDDSPMPAPVVEDGWIRGRGVWNMKASVAAYVAAVDAVRRSGISLRGDVVVAATAGAWDQTVVETSIAGGGPMGYGIGIKRFLEDRTADLAIVGEPTSAAIVDRHFGNAYVRVDVVDVSPPTEGREVDDITGDIAWGSGPTVSDAIALTAEIVTALRAWIPGYRDRNRLGHARVPVILSAVEAGRPWAPGGAAEASTHLFVGLVPGQDAEVVLAELRAVAEPLARNAEGLGILVRLTDSQPGPEVAHDSEIVRLMGEAHRDATGSPARIDIVTWYSDASQIHRAGIPVVNYGPRGRFLPDGREAVREDDLVEYTRACIALVVRACRDEAPA